MKHQETLIISASIIFGLFAISVGNIEQYAETQEFFSMTGLISILWAGAFYITIKQEK